MPSSVESKKMGFDIVPSGYISAVKQRVNVKEQTKEKLQELMKTANVLEQQVVLQDLLIAGRKMKTKEQRDMIALAAELFLKCPNETQIDFLRHIAKVESVFSMFFRVMLINSVYHDFRESTETGSTGLTHDQLERERAIIPVFDKYITPIPPFDPTWGAHTSCKGS